MTPDPSRRVDKLAEQLAEEFTVDPSVPYRDTDKPPHKCNDSSCQLDPPSTLVDPTIAFIPNLLDDTDRHTGFTKVTANTFLGKPCAPPGEVDDLEIASQDKSNDDSANPASNPEACDLPKLILMDSEYTESTLNLSTKKSKTRNILVLTNRRVIQIGGVSQQQNMAFIALKDINSATIQPERRGFRGYVWGALSLLIAVILWTNWNQPIGSVIVPIIVVLMGIYLVLDHVLSAKNLVVSFYSGPYSISGKVEESIPSENLTRFVNRIFELKEND